MRFYKVTVSGSFLPDGASSRSLGSVALPFLEIHSDDFIGDLTGDVTGDLTGNVVGDIRGDVLSDNDVACLVNGATPAASTFLGTATAAKYS